MTPITIEPMGLGDLDDVLGVDRVSFPVSWSRQAFLDALTRNPAARCSTAHCLVARMGGRLAGYLLLETIGATAVHVVHLAVHPDLRRLGVGRALLGAVIEEARQRGAGRVYLRVRLSNTPAQGLYRSLGFRVIERRPGHYADGEDAMLMQVTLPVPVISS
jgi:ribosomal-protein-alanine N-acetyltransferase